MKRRAFLARTAAAGMAAAFARPRASGAQTLSRPEPRPPASANLLRNGAFQDDWLSLMPQNQTLHWAYANTIYNRRDFNPDGWICRGLFHAATADQLAGLRAVVDHIRRATGKPVMVGHGGYWNRLEFEKVPYFQIYDPETEPFYAANLHTDLRPLVEGQEKVVWLRPQIYEDVPYERWRFHARVPSRVTCLARSQPIMRDRSLEDRMPLHLGA